METGDWHTIVRSSKLDWQWGVLMVEPCRWLIGCNITGANQCRVPFSQFCKSLKCGFIDNSWILISAVVGYMLFWLKYVKKIWPHKDM